VRLREQLVYTMFGDGITQLVQFASTLHLKTAS
jgi:hypothetical protein